MKKLPIIIAIIAFLVLVGAGSYLYLFKKSFIDLPITKQKQRIERGTCLGDNETADYKIEREGKWKGIINIFVVKQDTNQEINHFQIDTPSYNHYHPIELHKCNVYVIRAPIYDYKNDKLPPGSSMELWQYDYDGKGKKILIFSEKDEKGNFKANFSYDFRIDPTETYLVLEQGYLGKTDYALVIKDLKTKEDVFVLTLDDIRKINPGVELGSFNLGKWTDDGKHLWGTLFIGAFDAAYYRIEAGTWKTEVFSPPPDMIGGVERSMNFAGYIAYADFPTFFGIDIVAQQEQERFKQEGREKHLYLYNFRTKEKKLLTGTSDPAQRFNINWLSDTELEYELPTGEKKIYRIEK